MSGMGRREFVALIGGAAAWPVRASAQQSDLTRPVVGYLSSGSPESDIFRITGLRHGLNDAGYVEGRNVAVEYRWADNHFDRLAVLAADLVQRRVAVIIAPGHPSTLAAKAATTEIPILFVVGVNPVEIGLVATLNRPEGNLTGFNQLSGELGAKGIEVLHELLPDLPRIGLLVNPRNPVAELTTKDVLAAAHAIGLEIQVLHAGTDHELDTAFESLVRTGTRPLVVSNDVFFNGRIARLVALSAAHAIPTIYSTREFVLAGGLMSYGTSLTDSYRPVGVYAARILKGAKPAELPVQQQTRVEFVINMKTAKTLGLTFPITLLGRADEVIE
jgi:putative ABC transport system substrate-binding protein